MAGSGFGKDDFLRLGCELRDLRRQARRRHHHGLGLDAGRSRASLADCGNQGLLLLGLKRAKAPPSPDFSARFRQGHLFLVVPRRADAVQRRRHLLDLRRRARHQPEPLKWAWLAVGVLTFGIIAESLSMSGRLSQ